MIASRSPGVRMSVPRSSFAWLGPYIRTPGHDGTGVPWRRGKDRPKRAFPDGMLQQNNCHSLRSSACSFHALPQAALGSVLERTSRLRGRLFCWRRGRDCPRRAFPEGRASMNARDRFALTWRSHVRSSLKLCLARPVHTNARPRWHGRSLAEREGFEPPLPLRVKRFSRPPHSTALPPLQWCCEVRRPPAAARK